MASMNSFGQTALKNGVYEFSTTIDSVEKITSGKSKGETTIHRTLIVKNDTALYRIETIEKPENMPAYSFGIRDEYYLPIERKSGNSYKAGNADIELDITAETGKTITVEVVRGTITGFASGGAYITRTDVLPPEKRTLAFVRELTAQDEQRLSQAKEKI